jgi:hypothetical protein
MLMAKTQEWMNAVKDIWCQAVHDQPMWPINGRYQCRKCLRYHAVAWAQPQEHGVAEREEILQSSNSQVRAVAAQ